MSTVGKYIYAAEGREQPLYYLEGGSGWPVLLLHGWGCSSETMQPVFRHLEADFHVYNFDLPGFGLSPEPPAAWGLRVLAGGVHPKKLCAAAGAGGPFLWRTAEPAPGGSGSAAQDDINRLCGVKSPPWPGLLRQGLQLQGGQKAVVVAGPARSAGGAFE